MNYKIRKCTPDDCRLLSDLIRRSFRDVAERFGLTEENCPRHASNCTEEWIVEDMGRDIGYFILECEGRPAGCAGLETAEAGVCHLERLAVIPGSRRRGFGGALIEHAFSEAKRLGARSVGIGVIADHLELKRWYVKYGFVETENRKFAHLPFRVSFMACDLRRDMHPGEGINGGD
ncbi:MAG: GNAT family N-acetyltransferase [Syntrophales bacterium]